MVLVYKTKPDKREKIPAVNHVDDTGRPQTVERDVEPRYYRLIEEFARLTDVPMLLNTSFNENEPIVRTPAEAVRHVPEDAYGHARLGKPRRRSQRQLVAGACPRPFSARRPAKRSRLTAWAAADNYNAWLLERAQPFIGSRVLDFGVGTGTFTEALASRAEIVAIEPDSQFARGLRERFAGNERAAVVEADAAWLAEDSSQGAFDTVLCLNVLEHIRDDALVLRGFHDCLAPGGHLLLLRPRPRQAVRRNRSERRPRATVFAWPVRAGLLEQEGLEPVDIRYVNPLGAVGWLVASRLLRRDQVPAGPLRAYDRLVPVLRGLDRLRLPFGLSLWAVGRRVT